MSLRAFAEHARAMADSVPTDRIKATWRPGAAPYRAAVGDMSDRVRAQWAALADETEAYLADPRDPGPDDVPIC